MRDIILTVLMVAILFVSLEATAELVNENNFHHTHHAHADEGGNQWYPDIHGDEHDEDSCDHVCHGHVVALAGQTLIADVPVFRLPVTARQSRQNTRGPAPPTPPPNI